MFIPRLLDLMEATAHKSCFLFGPRQTGKSMLIRETVPKGTPIYELLDHRLWMDLSADPTRMRQEIEAKNLRNKLVVVDEIQKLPILLDEIQLLIETRKIRFLLTGSSARKLRRSGVNLLGGRARSRTLHPLSWKELGPRFDLMTALNRGLLPSVYFSDDASEDLRSYVGTYLKEEVTAEALTRNIPAFARFLEVAAACSGQMFNKTAVASDAQVPRTTVIEYFEILKDTLIGHELPAWNRSKKRKAIETAKFYLFDVGVARTLRKLPPLVQRSTDLGDALEHFLFHELRTYIDTRRPGWDLHYWRSTSQFEVDFILGEHTAIEVKATRRVSPQDLRGLEALAEEKMMKHLVLVCQEATPRKVGAILILPWQEFLERLWSDAFVA
jgi:predicted AAA+ superfamily ATPase